MVQPHMSLKQRLEAAWNDTTVRSATGPTVWRSHPAHGYNSVQNGKQDDLWYSPTVCTPRIKKRKCTRRENSQKKKS